jgi:uncharacterized protein (DUF1015 family)
VSGGNSGGDPRLVQSKFPMADIIPFRALRYNSERVRPDDVVTQPYDKISPAMQEHYYAASPYNLVRIILGRPEAGDDAKQNVYSRATGYFRDWRGKTILKQDAAPALYLYSQRFRVPGSTEERVRQGLIALGRVEDYSAKVVFRHEQTLAKPKADRLDLLRATRAHFEQLFLLYEDSGEMNSLQAAAGTAAPIIDVTDEYGVSHRVWEISDSKVVESIRSKMRDKKLVIADGHHRYETALNYRNELRASNGASGAPAPYEYVVMTFVDVNSPGLLILPTHRVVHSLTNFSVDDFVKASEKYFVVEKIDAGIDAAKASALLQEHGKSGTAILAVTPDAAFLLSKTKAAAAERMTGFSSGQQALDVVQLHKCLLEGVLQLSEESIRNQQNISYVRDAGEALQQVRSGKANITFLINPCRVQQVRDIAFAGEVMPQKSTDFYPKLLSGLTIYALD